MPQNQDTFGCAIVGAVGVVGTFGVFFSLILVLALWAKAQAPTTLAFAAFPTFTPTSNQVAIVQPQTTAIIPTSTVVPLPTDAPLALPTDTPVPTSTFVPVPTDTPVFTDTPTQIPESQPIDPNQGVIFGSPVVFGSGGVENIGVLATNTTGLVKSFTVKATYKTGAQIVATASGAVNDLLPGQTRAVTLLSQGSIPVSFDNVRVDVDTLIVDATSTVGSTVVPKIVFGSHQINTNGGFTTIDAEVINNDVAAHSFSVQATFVQNGVLVGTASGAVNDLAPGQTKTATLLMQGTTEGDMSIAIETIVN